MDETEVSHIKEVFNHSRALGAKEIGPGQHHSKCGVVSIGKVGKIPQRFAHADPDNAIAFPSLVCLGPRLERRRLVWLRRDAYTLAV